MVTITVCSLFSYFSIILFAAYTVNREISVRAFFLEICDFLSHCLHQHFTSKLYFCKKIISRTFSTWRHRSLAAYSVYEYIFQGFPTDFSALLQRCHHAIFLPINSSHKFPRWRYHSVYNLFSYWTHFSALFPRNFRVQIFGLNSSHRFARWHHRHICCLYSFLDEFLCVFVVLKNVPTQNPMFYTRVPLELSQLVVTWIAFTVKKISLFCLSNIVFYRL